MSEKCERCGSSATNFHEKVVERPSQEKLFQLLKQMADGASRRGSSSHIVPPGLMHSFQQMEQTGLKTIEENLTLRNILSEDHSIFSDFSNNKALEESRPNALNDFKEMRRLAKGQRKFSKNTRNWMNKKPFWVLRNSDKLNKSIWTKNVESLFDEPCERKEVICCKCGTIVRAYIDLEENIEFVTEKLKAFRTLCDYLDRYDSAMANWIRDDKAEKERAKKIRLEKKMQADLEALEVEKRAVEEKLRQLKGK